MNIYHVQWTEPGNYGMNAVVIATTFDNAKSTIRESLPSNWSLVIDMIGTYTGRATEPQVIAMECL